MALLTNSVNLKTIFVSPINLLFYMQYDMYLLDT
jgi:hypothetical protein